MHDPLRRFQQQPWLPLLQVTCITTVIVLLAEVVLFLGSTQSSALRPYFNFVFSGPLGAVLPFLAAVGVGALGVLLGERWQPKIHLNTGSLWALVLCLMGGMGIKVLILGRLLSPAYASLVALSEVTLMGIIVGVFWKGRPYWNSWR